MKTDKQQNLMYMRIEREDKKSLDVTSNNNIHNNNNHNNKNFRKYNNNKGIKKMKKNK